MTKPVPAARWSDNVPGRFYISQECILCSLCADIAPATFRLAESEDHAIVWRQPNTEAEVTLALQAVHDCGVEAVRDNGEP
jgi:ferredoxin